MKNIVFKVVKSKYVLFVLLFMCCNSCIEPNNKNSYEKNALVVRFINTKLGELENGEFKLIRVIEESGVIKFIEEHNAVIIRHDNGNDELLKINKSKSIENNVYLLSCDKNRNLLVDFNSEAIVYSIENNSAMFLFPITDISKLKSLNSYFPKLFDNSDISVNENQKKETTAVKDIKKNAEIPSQVLDSLKMKSPEPDTVKPNKNTEGPGEEIKSAEPVPQKLDVSKMAMEFFSRGVQHYEEKKYQQGISEFNKVVQMDPDNKDAFYNLGMGYYFTEDYYHALKNFREAARIDPQDSLSVLYCGLAKYFLGDYEGSIEYFDQAIELNPGFSDAWYNRGTARGQINDYEGAIADFTRAIELKPDYKEAYYNRGNAYFFANEREKACADWKKAKSLGSENTDKVLEAYCQEN